VALQAQQIVSDACSIAKGPGFKASAGRMLNMILSELCQNYDIELARGIAPVVVGSGGVGSGPYLLPTDYLRAARDAGIYLISGVPFRLINVDLAEFDIMIQAGGISNYPQYFATDVSQTPPAMYVWPPPSGVFTVNIRYYKQMPDITTPETSAAIPWFPDTNYLITRLAGEVMNFTDDTRRDVFLGDGPHGARGILDRWLKLQSDDEGRAKTVELDHRRFRSGDSSKNTKKLGW
jgi:hypothetical protein